jgi:hypothetical protein
MEVGSANTPTIQLASTEAWNGTNWTVENVPDAVHSRLLSVSCPSAADCTAVGDISFQTPLADSWNGTSWSAQSLPIPSGNSATLTGVSCTSPARCVAVGVEGPLSTPISESWNGTTWTPHTVTLPFRTTGDFNGVSCRSYRSCVAVGDIQTPSAFGPMAATWNGRSWTVENVPSPPGPSTDTTLEAVSCHSTTECIAVGAAGGPGAFQTLAEQWNGTAWTIMSMPRLGGAKAASNLASVSCPRAARCTAVGHTIIRNKSRLLAEHWNGTRWMLQAAVKQPFAQNSAFNGVSCLAKQGCIAVGDYNTHNGKNALLAEQHS